ncbi:MAG TPA: SRPBCC family protein [Nocardioidaceae bacterium]
MPAFSRTVTVNSPLDEAFAYLSDFTNTEEWDAGTVSTTRVSGDGGVGTTYRNISKFLGREVEVTYVVERVVPGEVFALRGENSSMVAHDTMTFREVPRGTEVTYAATFDFKGVAKLVSPLTKPVFNKLFDDGAKGIREALDRP